MTTKIVVFFTLLYFTNLFLEDAKKVREPESFQLTNILICTMFGIFTFIQLGLILKEMWA